MKNETWKPVVGYEGLYEISSIGRVKSLPKLTNQYGAMSDTRLLTPSTIKFGKGGIYRQVTLSKDGDRGKRFLVHRLVAMAFIPNPENKRTVNHKDGVGINNHVSNLEWATDSENNQHAYDVLGRKSVSGSQGKFNQDHHRSKEVYQFNTDGELITIWPSTMEIQRSLGIGNTSISKACRGEYKQVGGYIWKYKYAALKLLESKG